MHIATNKCKVDCLYIHTLPILGICQNNIIIITKILIIKKLFLCNTIHYIYIQNNKTIIKKICCFYFVN